MDKLTHKDIVSILESKGISSDIILNLLINSNTLSYSEINDYILKKQFSKESKFEDILVPVSIFSQNLSPLEALSQFLKKEYSMKNLEISQILCKQPAAISSALIKSEKKKFIYDKSSLQMPLRLFNENSSNSILNIVISYLKENGLTLTEIGKVLKRDPRTIWVIFNNAKENSSKKGERLTAKSADTTLVKKSKLSKTQKNFKIKK